MRKTFICFITAFAALSFAACSFGSLSPAKSGGSKAVLSLSLGTLRSDSRGTVSRAVVQGGGFLYIRTIGDSSGSAGALYGPYAVSAGDNFTTSDIPAGSYAKIAVLYAARELDDSATCSVLGGTYSWLGFMRAPDELLSKFFDTVGTGSADPGADALGNLIDGTATFGVKKNVTLKAGEATSLTVVLQPITCSGSAIDLSASQTKTFAPVSGGMDRKFYRLDGISVNLPVTSGSLTCTLSASSATAGSIGNVAFCDSDGRVLNATKTGSSLVSGYSWTIDAATANSLAASSGSGSSGNITLYLYLEYTGTINAKFADSIPPNLSVSLQGAATSSWQGKKLLFAVYDENAVTNLIGAQSMSAQTPIGLGVVSLDASSGAGETTIQIPSLQGGTTYYLMAMVDSNSHYSYSNSSDLGSADLATVIPYRNDYVLTEDSTLAAKYVHRLKPFVAGSAVKLTSSDFSLSSDYVYFASSTGSAGNDGLSPSTPKTYASAVSAANANGLSVRSNVYILDDISGIGQFTSTADVRITSYGSTRKKLVPANLSAITFAFYGGSLSLDDIIVDCSGVSTGGSSMISNGMAGGTNPDTVFLGPGCELIGSALVTPPSNGGGVYLTGNIHAASLTMFGSTIRDFRSSYGSAIYLYTNAVCNLVQANIQTNTAMTAGGGAVYVGTGATANAKNVMFSGNTNGDNVGSGTWNVIP